MVYDADMGTRTPQPYAREPDLTMSVRDAAHALHVTPRTVRNWIAAGRLKATRVSDRVTRVPVSEVERLIGRPALPDLSTVLWDVDAARLDPERDATFIIRRVLEAGRPAQVSWLFARYGEDRIAAVAASQRALSPRVAAAWSLLLRRRRDRPA
jgi:excisionase family DNA binding protein